MKTNLTKRILAVGLMAVSLDLASAQQYLAVDFRPDGGNSPTDLPSTRAVFEAADPNLTAAADTDFHILTGTGGTPWNGLAAPGVALGAFTVATSGASVGGSNAGSASWTDLEPVLESYHYKRDAGADSVSTVTISGIGADEGDLITLTIFGVGDNTGQDTTFTVRYAGESQGSKESYYGDDRATGTNAEPFVTYSFLADGINDTVEFDWVRHAGRYCALNGFSLSVSDAGLGDVTAAALGSPAQTVYLNGSPSIQLPATADFSVAGAGVEVNALGSSVVQFSSDNPSVVSVDDTGTVSFLAPGTANITATVFGDNSTQAISNSVGLTVEAPTNIYFQFVDFDNTDDIPITLPYLVEEGPEGSVNVLANSASLTAVPVEDFSVFSYNIISGTSVELAADFEPEDYEPGDLLPFSPGTTTIEAEFLVPNASPVTATLDVIVESPLSIDVSTNASTFYVGGAEPTVTATISTANITDLPINGLISTEFISSDETILEVDSITGVVSAAEPPVPGTASITADYNFGQVSDSVSITLSDSPPERPLSICHRYSFNATAGPAAAAVGVITDSVGGAHGDIVGEGASFDGTSLTIPGGEHNGTAAYVDLPNGIISVLPEAVTIEAWVTINTVQNWTRIFDFGSNLAGENGVSSTQTNHFMLTPQASGGGGVYSELTESRSLYGNNGVSTGTTVTAGQEHHFVVTHDSELGVRNIYLDGVLIGTGPSPFGVSDLSDFVVSDGMGGFIANDVNNWLGRSNATDPRLNGSYNEFRIWKGTMAPEQVAANAAGGPETLLSEIVTDLGLSVTDFTGATLEVEASGLAIGSTYYFEVLNPATSSFDPIAGTEFVAAGATESRSISTAGLGSTALVRLVQGALPLVD